MLQLIRLQPTRQRPRKRPFPQIKEKWNFVIPVEFETAHSTLFRQLLKIRKQHKPKREPAAEFDSFFGRLPPCSDGQGK